MFLLQWNKPVKCTQYIAEAYIKLIITMTQLYEQEAENEFMLFTQPLVKE